MTEVEYIGQLLDMLLLGIYTCLFGATIWLVIRKNVRFTFATLSVVALYFLNLANTIVTLTVGSSIFAVLTISMIIADGTLLWRLYIIWLRDIRVVILPAVVMALGTSCAIAITASAGADYEDSWTDTLATLMYITFGSSVFINSVVTGLIVSRLYRLGRRAAAGRDSKHPYLRIIAALVESGSLFLFSVTIYLILYATGSKAGDVVITVLPKIIGMAPTLITLQLALGFIQPADIVGTDNIKTTILFVAATPPANVIVSVDSSSDLESQVSDIAHEK